jgi:hypothetical protein
MMATIFCISVRKTISGNWNMEEISPFTLKKVQDNAKADWEHSCLRLSQSSPVQFLYSVLASISLPNDSVTVGLSALNRAKELSHAVYAVVNNMITISTAPYSTGSYLVTISKDWLSTSKTVDNQKETRLKIIDINNYMKSSARGD